MNPKRAPPKCAICPPELSRLISRKSRITRNEIILTIPEVVGDTLINTVFLLPGGVYLILLKKMRASIMIPVKYSGQVEQLF